MSNDGTVLGNLFGGGDVLEKTFNTAFSVFFLLSSLLSLSPFPSPFPFLSLPFSFALSLLLFLFPFLVIFWVFCLGKV